MKPLFVIMVTYRRFEHFKKTLESLAPTLPTGSKVTIIYNREGKHESDQQYCNYFHSVPFKDFKGRLEIEALETGTNEGWGASMNEGLTLYSDWKDYEYVLESNNDVEYSAGWFEKAKAMMDAHPEVGILGLWKHPYHGTREVLADGLVIKDDMPATAWFMRSKDLVDFLPFPDRGPCKTRGGNGEDVGFRENVQNKLGRWVCGTTEDLAKHIDGYGIPDLGKDNPAYV